MRYKAVLLFGAPGSGKGTQGKILGSIPGFYHNATGEIFRSLDLQSEMGRVFWEYARRGELVPDELTIRLWKQYIKGDGDDQSVPSRIRDILVLDGLPRDLEQAKLVEDTIDVQKVIYLRCADLGKMVERLAPAGAERKPLSMMPTMKVIHAGSWNTKPRPGRCWSFYPPEKIEQIDATMSQIRVLNAIF